MGKFKNTDREEKEEFFEAEEGLHTSRPVIPMRGKKSFAAAFEEYGRKLRKGKGAKPWEKI